MPPAAGPASMSDRIPMVSPTPIPVPETFARDAIIAWFRGEFAAANAIIDSLCNHLTQLTGLGVGHGSSEYESVFAAIHRRRLNWIPILQMQKYYSIADVTLELRRVAANKVKKREEEEERKKNEEIRDSLKVEEERDEIQVANGVFMEELKDRDGNGDEEVVKEDDDSRNDLSDRKVNDDGKFQEEEITSQNIQICFNHEDYEGRRALIKTTKGFVAREPVKGHMVNVVKGLKLYEDIFTDSELSKLTGFVNELRLAGRNGELSGETFTLFNQQLKGNKRELIQLGVPIFGQIKEEATSKSQMSIEPIPSVLQAVIDHLVQWRLIPESRKPNSCTINFFDEGEYSQPYLKPPHLDQPISTLLLSESTMAFGRVLMSDHHGNYKGPLMLSLKEGSLLVMCGNSADMARHVICPAANKRISITFFKVRLDRNQIQPSTIHQAMTLWQPGGPQPYKVPNGAFRGYESMDMFPKWGVIRSPLVMLGSVRPMVMNSRRITRGGTGVFLPWTNGTKKYAKHLPPRAQRGRLLPLPSPVETQVAEPTSEPGLRV